MPDDTQPPASQSGQPVNSFPVRLDDYFEGRDPSVMPKVEPVDDVVLNIVQKVVDSIKNGTNLDAEKDDITRLINNQEHRAELIDQLTLTHDYSRYIRFLKVQASLENYLMKCIDNDNLTPSEAWAFLKYITAESGAVYSRIKGGATSVKDIASLLQKVDYTIQNTDKSIMKKFNKTTHQGREVIRKLATRVLKSTALREENRD